MVAGKRIGATRRDLEFRPSGLLDMEPVAVAGDGERAARRQLVPADIGIERAAHRPRRPAHDISAIRAARMSRPFWFNVSSARLPVIADRQCDLAGRAGYE